MEETMDKLFSSFVSSKWGPISLLWRHKNEIGWQLVRVYLSPERLPPSEPVPLEESVLIWTEKIRQALSGLPVDFDLNTLPLSLLKPWHRKVLIECHQVPRGRVMSYKSLAIKAGMPSGARPIGMAMARNPFPLIIPCHRIVRSDGKLGGYGGGWAMKRDLLFREGIRFTPKGSVDKGCFIYP